MQHLMNNTYTRFGYYTPNKKGVIVREYDLHSTKSICQLYFSLQRVNMKIFE